MGDGAATGAEDGTSGRAAGARQSRVGPAMVDPSWRGRAGTGRGGAGTGCARGVGETLARSSVLDKATDWLGDHPSTSQHNLLTLCCPNPDQPK